MAAVVVAAALVAPASAAASTHEATANGNPFTGGLSFAPAELDVSVGDTVRWTNTDSSVPHTVTEKYGLFDLGGNYGIPGSMGFGPGESVEWRFAAGGWDYFCEIHPEMTGHVDAPVKLRRRGKGRSLGVVVRWAAEEPPEGQFFDVQRSNHGRAFRSVLDGTRELRSRFQAQRGDELAFRARVRVEANPGEASGWSPPATIAID